MQKNPLFLSVIGTLFILFSVGYIVANHLNEGSILADFICLALVISAVGTLRLKNWARIGFIVFLVAGGIFLLSFIIQRLTDFFLRFKDFSPEVNKLYTFFFDFDIAVALTCLGFILFVIFYLIRNKKKFTK